MQLSRKHSRWLWLCALWFLLALFLCSAFCNEKHFSIEVGEQTAELGSIQILEEQIQENRADITAEAEPKIYSAEESEKAQQDRRDESVEKAVVEEEDLPNFGRKMPKPQIARKRNLFVPLMEYKIMDDRPVSLAFSHHQVPKKGGISSYTAFVLNSGFIQIHDHEGNLLTNEDSLHPEPMTALSFTGKDSYSGGFIITGDEAGFIYFRNMTKYREVVIRNPAKPRKQTLYRYNLPVNHTIEYAPLSHVLQLYSYDRWGYRLVISIHKDGTFRKFFYNGTLYSEENLTPSTETDIVIGKSADSIIIVRGIMFDIFNLRYDNRVSMECALPSNVFSVSPDLADPTLLYIGTIDGTFFVIKMNTHEERHACQVLYTIPSGASAGTSACETPIHVAAVADYVVTGCLMGNLTIYNTQDISTKPPVQRSSIFYPVNATQDATKKGELPLFLCNRNKQLLVGSQYSNVVYLYNLDIDFPIMEFGRYRAILLVMGIVGFVFYNLRKKKKDSPIPDDLMEEIQRFERLQLDRYRHKRK